MPLADYPIHMSLAITIKFHMILLKAISHTLSCISQCYMQRQLESKKELHDIVDL